MLRRLWRAAEHASAFVVWIRLYPHLSTKEGRESIVEELLLNCLKNADFLEEMAAHAQRVLDIRTGQRP